MGINEMNNTERIELLKKNRILDPQDLRILLTSLTGEEEQCLYDAACEVRRENYGTDGYLRGLIAFSREMNTVSAIASRQTRFWSAPSRVMRWDFARSFCRAARICGIPMRRSAV